ncbi:hypothetical protein Q5692_32720 [Microcoleus sp. C2C3]|uniref:hypothetical protein n=1 Tax=unclassified Microcoleus TaxID=2642155 RepID=UPI002FD5E344
MRVWLRGIYLTGAVSGGAIGSIADPTLPSLKSSEGRDYLYRTQIQQLATCAIVKGAIEANILTNALPPL